MNTHWKNVKTWHWELARSQIVEQHCKLSSQKLEISTKQMYVSPIVLSALTFMLSALENFISSEWVQSILLKENGSDFHLEKTQKV